MSLIYDEYGRPYIVIRDQETKVRLKGLDAQKVRWWSEKRGPCHRLPRFPHPGLDSSPSRASPRLFPLTFPHAGQHPRCAHGHQHPQDIFGPQG